MKWLHMIMTLIKYNSKFLYIHGPISLLIFKCTSIICVLPLHHQAFLPLLHQAAKVSGTNVLSCSKAAIINITTKLSSIDDNKSGGYYPYRTSKVRPLYIILFMKVMM